MASFDDGVETGRPLDAYTFSWPFARLSKRVQMTTDFGMGVSWNWMEFSEETKDYRTVLGSNVNARIDWGSVLYAVRLAILRERPILGIICYSLH